MSIYEKADQAPYFVLTENLTVIAYFSYENIIFYQYLFTIICIFFIYFNLFRNKQ